jgi:hypothetical protein
MQLANLLLEVGPLRRGRAWLLAAWLGAADTCLGPCGVRQGGMPQRAPDTGAVRKHEESSGGMWSPARCSSVLSCGACRLASLGLRASGDESPHDDARCACTAGHGAPAGTFPNPIPIL